jgi:hypothetical protein
MGNDFDAAIMTVQARFGGQDSYFGFLFGHGLPSSKKKEFTEKQMKIFLTRLTEIYRIFKKK